MEERKRQNLHQYRARKWKGAGGRRKKRTTTKRVQLGERWVFFPLKEKKGWMQEIEGTDMETKVRVFLNVIKRETSK